MLSLRGNPIGAIEQSAGTRAFPSPRRRIESRVQRELKASFADLVRGGWERFGDLVVLKFRPRVPLSTKRKVAAIAANELFAASVLEDAGGVKGKLRTPNVRLLYGRTTRTVHTENGIVYGFDAAKVMFSSGNVAERTRMARLDCVGQTVVDLFAGIGYFTLPLAARAGAERVFACEKNPVAFRFLKENLSRNRVASRVSPLLGDCRSTAPEGVADRVVLGYIGGTERFLPVALRALKPGGGVVHFHEAYPQETKFADAKRALGRAVCGKWKVEIVSTREVKSFAPGIDHIVVDARFRPVVRRSPA